MVCHQLGYSGAESYSVDNNYGDNDLTGYERYRLKNVLCRGDEASLFDCSFEEHSGFVSYDNRIAGVSCIDEPLPSTTTSEPETSSPSFFYDFVPNVRGGWVGSDVLDKVPNKSVFLTPSLRFIMLAHINRNHRVHNTLILVHIANCSESL